MLNHLHAMGAFSNTRKNINQIIRNVKRFVAYDIVDKLKEKKRMKIFYPNAESPSGDSAETR